MLQSNSCIDGVDVLDLLTTLVERSLVTYDDVSQRYSMLETVRHYSRERLLDTGEGPKLRAKHTGNILDLVVELSKITDIDEAIRAMRTVDSELDNIRAAAMHTIASGDIVNTTTIVRSLGSYWLANGNIEEPISLLRMALDPYMDGDLDRDQAAALLEMCSFEFPADEMSRAHAERALKEYERLNDPKQIAECHRLLGNVELIQGRIEEAEQHLKSALERAADADLTGRILSSLAALAMKHENLDEARRCLESITSEHPGIRIGAMINLILVDIKQMKLDEAKDRLIAFGEIVAASKAAIGYPTFGQLSAQYFAAAGKWRFVPPLLMFTKRTWAEMNHPMPDFEKRSLADMESRTRAELGSDFDALGEGGLQQEPSELVRRTMALL